MSAHLVVLTTLATEEDGAHLARLLLSKGVVACVNVVPAVRSLYRWKGVIEDERECLLLMKTRADRFESLQAAIAEHHPYEVPELVALPVDRGGNAYLEWIDHCLSAGSPDRNE